VSDTNNKYFDGISEQLDLNFGAIGDINFNSIPATNTDPILLESSPTNPSPNPVVVDYLINYEIIFISNLQNEVGDLLSLEYNINSGDVILDTDKITLSDYNTDGKKLLNSKLKDGNISLNIKGELPANYKILKIYWANRKIAETNKTDFTKWNSSNRIVTIPASELLTGGLAVSVVLEKGIDAKKPILSLSNTKYDFNVKDSDVDVVVNIPFISSDTDLVDFYLTPDRKVRVDATSEFVNLSFKNDFGGVYGSKKIIVVPYSDSYGTGDRTDIIVNFISVNDFPSITQITAPSSIDVPSFSDLQIEYEVEWNSFAVSSIDVELLQKNNTKISLFKNLAPNGKFKINLRDLANKFPNWNGSDNVTLTFKPYNRLGSQELIGNEYEIKTTLSIPSISLDEDILKKSLFDAFVANLKFTEPEKESKYLTHLANFGNDEQIIVSSWEEDNFTLSDKGEDTLGNTIVTKEVESLILKLYSPLPANITENSTLWITKLLTNPLIETVVLSQQDEINCPPIKGPNFNVDVDFVMGKSTGYESLDDLILSASVSSSSNLIREYLSSSLVNTDDLNIEYYTSGSTDYEWDNFIHFSSAKERVENFVYKVQLIEKYEELISQSLYYSGSVAQISAGSGSVTGSISSLQERERQLIKKNQIVNGFDGFEKFLYTPSEFTTSNDESITWPYNGSIRLLSTNAIVKDNWYVNIINLAEAYDINNPNYVLNNIPQYIVNNTENQSLLLFFSMIGQHFDNIYYYTKSIEKSRGLGYKATNGISDKLLFDVLKSFNWDAKNLSADSQLWNYVFGMDSDGNQQYKPTYDKNGRLVPSNPAKQRTYEVWRRIINNLPYLLKHKGTRRGVYAILSCYGIPSSNLSILEFGGPEVTDNTKNKLIYDNITSALKFYGENSGSIKLEWKNTERNRKPDTIEFFAKPAYSGDFTIVSGSGWNVKLFGAPNSEYGNVIFNYSGSNAISSSLLPIFNGNFFGIEVSRTSGSISSSFELNVRQSNKERTIFQESISASILNVSASWDGGNYIYIASGSTGYSGSLDEFRLWSTPLDKERFYEHVSFPEMINGNHVSSSTDDLFFRLDFEYPKNLAVSSSLLNVDTNIYFSSSLYRNDLESGSITNGTLIFSENPSASYSASAIGFPSLINYPFQFEAIDRTVVLEIPDVGSGRYSTNKVRFESQTLVSDLSYKNRATKKAFDQSPVDSNRVGLFFSPTKELNIDIAKSLGGLNLDNYIGDPTDEYKSNYTRLDSLRNYYFQRFDGRDIYAYINLIKLYEKSMFEDIKKMLPARVKATTGLLIEPHILERSKIARKRPVGEDYQQEVTIHYQDTTIMTSENNQYDALVNVDLSENLIGENNQYDSVVDANLSENLIADSYQYDGLIDNNDTTITNAESYQKEVNIDAGLGEPTITTEINLGIETYGQTAYETIGFGIYAQNGNAIRTYFDKDNRKVKERIRVQLITEEKERIVSKFAVTASVNGLGDPRGGYISDIQTYTETKLNIQPFSGSNVPNVQGNIIAVVPVDGYLPTHYRNTSDLTRGLENSFFRGSKNTAATTLDGTPPVETFVSNPNTLTVNRTGRNTSEPILEVE
jgi:hypothetical protein